MLSTHTNKEALDLLPELKAQAPADVHTRSTEDTQFTGIDYGVSLYAWFPLSAAGMLQRRACLLKAIDLCNSQISS